MRLAATVMLVRPSNKQAFDVLMLRRSGASHFVPDAYVFPGGTVDDGDYAQALQSRVAGLDHNSVLREFRMTSNPHLKAPVGATEFMQARAVLVAALRELYEEAGVLLACDEQGTLTLHTHGNERGPYAQALARHGVMGDARSLALFSHWITPPVYPKRYNTHFFVALADAGQPASADAIETIDGIWISPSDAIAQAQEGNMSIVYPTMKHLERLREFRNTGDLLEYTRTKPIFSIMPRVEGEHHFGLPDELEMAW